MNKQLLKDGFGWGFGLWLIGYVLGIVFFIVVPPNLIGWVITPIGIALSLWVLLKKVKTQPISSYLLIGIIWTLIAIAGDYLFIVKLLKPVDGYYKLDVYLYYLTTLLLPPLVGWWKHRNRKKTNQG